MKKYNLILILLLVSTVAGAQKLSIEKFREHGLKPIIVERENYNPILTEFIIRGEHDIDSIRRLTTEEVKFKYGNDFVTAYGAIVYYLKPNLKYTNINDIYLEFNISKEAQTLPLYIDQIKVECPESIICITGNVYSVEVMNYTNFKEKRTEKIVQITTKMGYNILKKRNKSLEKLTPVKNNLK